MRQAGAQTARRGAQRARETEGRAFLRQPSPEQQDLLNGAAARFRDAADDEARMELLDALAEVPDARVLPVVEQALKASDVDLRRRALDAVGGYAVAAVIPLAQRGLADSEAEVPGGRGQRPGSSHRRGDDTPAEGSRPLHPYRLRGILTR